MLMFALVACSKGKSNGVQESFCAVLDRAYSRQIDCAPTRREKDLIAAIRAHLHDDSFEKTNADGSMEHYCAVMLAGIQQADPAECDLGISPDERAAVSQEVNRHTAVPTTGEPALDAEINRLSRLRDRACSCDRPACIAGLEKEFDRPSPLEAAGRTGKRLPKDVSDALGKVIDEFSECIGRAERGDTATDPPH